MGDSLSEGLRSLGKEASGVMVEQQLADELQQQREKSEQSLDAVAMDEELRK